MRYRRTVGDWVSHISIEIVLYVGAFLTLTPLLWMISASTKPAAEIFVFPIRWIPETFHFTQNIEAVFARVPFAQYYFNSVFVSTAATLIAVFFCTLAGYSFAKFHYPGRNVIFVLVLGTMMIPFQAVLIPLFLIVLRLDWVNTYQGLIVPGSITSFSIFLTRQYILSIPDELLDAARVDGCSEIRIFLTVVMPLAKPILSTMAIFSFLAHWNNYLWPLVIVNVARYRTLPLGLAMFQDEYSTAFNELMTASLLATIPVFLVFMAFQRHFIHSMMGAGIKG